MTDYTGTASREKSDYDGLLAELATLRAELAQSREDNHALVAEWTHFHQERDQALQRATQAEAERDAARMARDFFYAENERLKPLAEAEARRAAIKASIQISQHPFTPGWRGQNDRCGFDGCSWPAENHVADRTTPPRLHDHDPQSCRECSGHPLD